MSTISESSVNFDQFSVRSNIHSQLEKDKVAALLKDEHADPFSEDDTELLALSKKPVCFAVIGKPGCGKTTLAKKIRDAWNCELVNPTEVINSIIQTNSEQAEEIKAKLYCGESLTDELVFEFMLEKLRSPEVKHHGYILDGFPSLNDTFMPISKQLEILKSMSMPPDFIINLKMTNEDLQTRRVTIRIDFEDGALYGKEFYDPEKPEKPPKEEKEEVEGEEEEEEEEMEEEEELEEFSGSADFPLLSPDVIQRLLRRPEDMPQYVKTNIDEYRSKCLRQLEDLMANHDQQFLIELNGCLLPSEIFRQAIFKIRSFNVQPAVSPTRLFDIDNEEDQPPEDMDTEELMRMLSPKKMPAPRFRWLRSRWLRYCPVALQEGNLVQGKPEFSVSFYNKIYCLSSMDAFAKFLKNPRPYLLPPQPRPPCKVVVAGPPHAGKTTTAFLLAERYNAQVIDFDACIQPHLEQAKNDYHERVRTEATNAAIAMVQSKLKQEAEAIREAALRAKEEAEEDARIAAEEAAKAEEEEDDEEERKEEEKTGEEEEHKEEREESEKEQHGDGEQQKSLLNVPSEASQSNAHEEVAEPEVDEKHPEVIAIVEAKLKEAGEVVIDNKVYIDVLKNAVRQAETERRMREPDGPLHGGWVIDNFPTNKDIWNLLLDEGGEALPDELVILRDSSDGGDFLLKRWYQRNKTEIRAKIEARINQEAEEKRRREEEALRKLEEERKEQERLEAERLAQEAAEGDEDEENEEDEEKEDDDDKGEVDEQQEDAFPKPYRPSEVKFQDPVSENEQPVQENKDPFDEPLPPAGPEIEEEKLRRKQFESEFTTIVTAVTGNTSIDPMEIVINERSKEDIVNEIVAYMEKPFKYQAWEQTGQDIEEEDEDNEAAKAEEQKAEEEDEEEDAEEEEEDPNRGRNKRLGETNYFCPVSLLDNQVLWPGNPEIAVKYRGKLYYFVSNEARDKFLENPAAFVPAEGPATPPPLRLLILGPKGSGKTLHGKQLAKELGLFHISFRDRLQEIVLPKTRKRIGPDYEEQLEELPQELSEAPDMAVTGPDGQPIEPDEAVDAKSDNDEEDVIFTELEENVKNNIEKQDPLSNEVMEQILARFWRTEPFKNTGFILEGFPRTPDEANFLAEFGLFIDGAIMLKAEDPEIIARLLPPKMQIWKDRRKLKNEIKEKNKEKLHKAREEAIERRRKELEKENEEAKKERLEQRRIERQQRIEDGEVEDEEEEEDDEEEEEEANDIEAILAEEFEEEEEMEEEDEETEEDARERLKNDINDVYDNDLNSLDAIKEIFDERLIPRFEVDSGKKPHIVRRNLRRQKELRHLIKGRKSIFERAFVLSEKTASNLLATGYKQLSNFGRWCPVALYEGECLMPLMEEGHPTFPAAYQAYVYFCSSSQRREEFIADPRKYLDGSMYPKIVVPIRIAVLGPPKSGKTSLANRFVQDLGVVRLSAGEALRRVLQEQKNTALAKEIGRYLLAGQLAPDELVVQAVEVMLLDTRTSVRGFVLDGFPCTLRQVRLLSQHGIVPNKVIYMNADNQEVMIRGTNDRLRSDKPYVMHDSAQILAVRLSHYAKESELVLQWYHERHRNLCQLDASKSKWYLWEACVDAVKKQIQHIQQYIFSVRRGLAASIADMCITDQEFLARLGEAGQYCPVRLQKFGELADNKEVPDLKHAAEFRGRYYKCQGDVELREFLASPSNFVPPLASRSLPSEDLLPKKMRGSEVRAKFPMQMSLKGYCPVTFRNGGLCYESLVPGDKEILAEYRGRIFCFADAAAQDTFMRLPELYWDLQLPAKLPPPKSPADVTRLPIPGFLEQTLADAMRTALSAAANFKPKFPFLSPARSASIYVALHLKAFNPKSPEHVRQKYTEKLLDFEAKCRIIEFLGDNMTLKYKEPAKRPKNLDGTLETFQKLKKQMDEPAMWTT